MTTDHPGGRRAARIAIVLGLLVLLGTAVAMRGRIVEVWRVHQFSAAAESERWELAKELATMGQSGREAAEEWYLGLLRSGKLPSEGQGSEPEILKALGEFGSACSVPVFLEYKLNQKAANEAFNALWPILNLVQEREPHPSLLEIIRGLGEDKEKRIRIRACGFLTVLGPVASEARITLERILSDRDPEIRCAATETLFEMGMAVERILGVLIPIIGDRTVPDASEALGLVMRLQEDALPALPALIDRMRFEAAAQNDSQTDESERAISGLGERAIPSVVALLDDPQSQVRMISAGILLSFGSRAYPATEQLTGTLQDESSLVAQRAVFALGAIGPEACSAVPALVKFLLGAEDLEDRDAAIFALAEILLPEEENAQALEVIPLVQDIVDPPGAPRDESRIWPFATALLIKIDPGRKDVLVSRLMTELRQGRNQCSTIEAIGLLGSLARAERETLLKVALSKIFLSQEAARTLAVAGIDDLEPVMKAFRGESMWIRHNARKIFSALGPAAIPVLPQLLECLESPDFESRVLSSEVIGGIGPAAKEAVPLLEARLRDRNIILRQSSVGALRKIRGR